MNNKETENRNHLIEIQRAGQTALMQINERVVNDKKFLLEMSNAGYDPLDKEDVHNFLEKLPPKNQNRNLTLCGGYMGQSLGCSNESEMDIENFRKENPSVGSSIKRQGDIHLGDLSSKDARTYLEESTINSDIEEFSVEQQKRTGIEIDDSYRTNISKVFGSEGELERLKRETRNNNNNEGMLGVATNNKASRILELIAEFKSLGFTPEEIKKEIINLNL